MFKLWKRPPDHLSLYLVPAELAIFWPDVLSADGFNVHQNHWRIYVPAIPRLPYARVRKDKQSLYIWQRIVEDRGAKIFDLPQPVFT
jgi:hypothetical protein